MRLWQTGEGEPCAGRLDPIEGPSLAKVTAPFRKSIFPAPRTLPRQPPNCKREPCAVGSLWAGYVATVSCPTCVGGATAMNQHTVSVPQATANITAVCSIELEQELLGCALINQSFDAIERLLSTGDFCEPLHAQLFETIASVHSMHGAVSYQLVAASMGSYAGTLIAEGMTTGQYLAKLAAEACLPPRCGCPCKAGPRVFQPS